MNAIQQAYKRTWVSRHKELDKNTALGMRKRAIAKSWQLSMLCKRFSKLTIHKEYNQYNRNTYVKAWGDFQYDDNDDSDYYEYLIDYY